MTMKSNSHTGAQAIVVATMATGTQPSRKASAVVAAAKAMHLACYSCGAVFLAGDFDASTKLCSSCYDAAGLENEHSDTGGDHDGLGPVAGCPLCAGGGD